MNFVQMGHEIDVGLTKDSDRMKGFIANNFKWLFNECV